MKVLIVGKTHQKDGLACIGGLLLGSLTPVRLLPSGGGHSHPPEKYGLGDVWEMELNRPGYQLRAPHQEDMYVAAEEKCGTQPSLGEFLIENLHIQPKTIQQLFSGKLQFTTWGSGYISEEGGIPEHSTEFWLLDHPLNYKYDARYDKHEYVYTPRFGAPQYRLKYVGFEQPPINTIPRGTLVRLSLARWWDQKGNTEQRCSLQLSGWY